MINPYHKWRKREMKKEEKIPDLRLESRETERLRRLNPRWRCEVWCEAAAAEAARIWSVWRGVGRV